MEKLNDLQEFVQVTIDRGVTSIEGVHKAIAEMPFDLLAKITPLKGVADGVKEIQANTIGTVYESIRLVNEKAGEIAARLLGQGKAKE